MLLDMGAIPALFTEDRVKRPGRQGPPSPRHPRLGDACPPPAPTQPLTVPTRPPLPPLPPPPPHLGDACPWCGVHHWRPLVLRGNLGGEGDGEGGREAGRRRRAGGPLLHPVPQHQADQARSHTRRSPPPPAQCLLTVRCAASQSRLAQEWDTKSRTALHLAAHC